MKCVLIYKYYKKERVFVLRKEIIEVRNWEDLSHATSDQFNIEVDAFTGSARILNLNGDVVFYLSTHSFYENHLDKSNEALHYFGFNAVLVRSHEQDRTYTVNEEKLEEFLSEFKEKVYPEIVNNGGVDKLEKIVEERRKQVAENKIRRKEAERRNEKSEDI